MMLRISARSLARHVNSHCNSLRRASLSTSFQLNDGFDHPKIGFGTYKVGVVPASASAAGGARTDDGIDEANAVISDAISVGYRMFDCAEFYENEHIIGPALQSSGVDREDLYLVSKVWCSTLYEGPDAVARQVEKCLTDLCTDYLDLFLIHWPVPEKHIEGYKVLERLQREGMLRSIGVSNYAVEDYQRLMAEVDVKPAVNQIEINPFLFRQKTIDFFRTEGVLLHSYRSLRNGEAFNNPVLMDIAAKHECSVAQVLGRWTLDQGFVYIPKSVSKARMVENKEVWGFELDGEDMSRLNSLTTQDNIDTFRELYHRCIVRDTPLAESWEQLREEITAD